MILILLTLAFTQPIQYEKPRIETSKDEIKIEKFSIEDKIISKAREYEINPELALAIIKCESGFDRFIKNKGSSAESYWQFLDSTWRYTMQDMGYSQQTSKSDEKLSLEAGFFLLKKDGTRHWKESQFCWEPKFASVDNNKLQ